MLNPRDLLSIPYTGDDDVGDTYSDQPDVTPAQSEAGYSRGKGHRQQQPILPQNDASGAGGGGVLAANGQNVYTSPYAPEMWSVLIPNIAGVTVEISLGRGASLPPLTRLGPGGKIRCFGIGDSITLVNITAVVCYPQVVAIQVGDRDALSAGSFEVAAGGVQTK